MLVDGGDHGGRVATGAKKVHAREYHRMGEVGSSNRPIGVELIRGEIVEMSPIGKRHVAFVDNLNQFLVTRLAGRAIVSGAESCRVLRRHGAAARSQVLRRRVPRTRSVRRLERTRCC